MMIGRHRQPLLFPLRVTLICLLWVSMLTASNTDWIDDLGGAVTRDASGEVTGADLRATWVADTDLRITAWYFRLELLASAALLNVAQRSEVPEPFRSSHAAIPRGLAALSRA